MKNRKKPVTLIDDEGNEIKCTLWGDCAQRFNDFLNSCDEHGRIVLVLQFAMMKFWDGKMCIQNGYWGTKLYLFDGNKAIYEDEYKEIEELFANQPSEQSENIATKISTASKNSTKDTFVNKHPIRNIAELLDVEHGVQSVIVGTVIAIQEDEGWWFRLQIRVQDETETMSLSLFNDEVQAMVGRSAYQLCEKYAKGRVSQMQQQDTNVVTTPFPFGLNRSLTLENSIGPQKTASTVVTPTIQPFSTQTSTYEVGESSKRTKRSKRLALQNRTPIRFNLDDDGNVRKVYDKYYGISEEKYDHGDPIFECKECHALLWEAEAKRGNPNSVNKAYSICCKKGKVMLEKPPATPKP
nr:hypothetical protein [Tanacetum cinerariifolium]